MPNPMQAVGHWRRALTYIQIAPIPGAKEIAAVVQSSSFLSVRNQIICLDDLERKSDGLKIKDVLGLVSLLKEDRRCKVAIILNDGAFETAEKEDFERFFEKTIDSHVEFSPTPQECAEIALPDASDLHATMRRCCERLQISNIRVVKRIERLALVLREALVECDARVLEEAYKTLTLIGWSMYAEGAAPLEFIAERRTKQLRALNAQPSEDEMRWEQSWTRTTSSISPNSTSFSGMACGEVTSMSTRCRLRPRSWVPPMRQKDWMLSSARHGLFITIRSITTRRNSSKHLLPRLRQGTATLIR